MCVEINVPILPIPPDPLLFFVPSILMREKWSLESLAFGPLARGTDFAFWHAAFRNHPAVFFFFFFHLKGLTVIYCFLNSKVMTRIAGLRRHFPRLMRVEVPVTTGWINTCWTWWLGPTTPDPGIFFPRKVPTRYVLGYSM